MWKTIALASAALVFSFVILLISIFRTASVKYDFNPRNPDETKTVLGGGLDRVEYYLPYPGKILPDNPLWPLKAVRDRLWLWVNNNPSREAELTLLFADKRIRIAKTLFDNGKPATGLSTLTKAEKYLEEANRLEKINRMNGINTDDFLVKLSGAALKHYEILEYLEEVAPESSRPAIIKAQDYPKKVYEDTRNTLLDKKINPVENPFVW